ncbi:hypothetical protein C482_02761 [Natrialba chahannaoensis JCM 10990]|uniref:Uncharacterized protein n=1 Tax=Natrialba chahannaoensis JCM 10990 TaxID=1227492 RepID=M0B2N9_9EURY|nr:hypothetical protein [Natrialba chahannaoensis]ELZ05040.1 hypothetical protein C482_02761 [Natrialba chahannaoensis JCM 10990]
MTTYYVISSPDHDANRPHSRDWPKVLRLSFEDCEIRLYQGKGHGLGGTSYDFDEFQVEEWTEFVDACAGDWLLEELSRYESLTTIEETDFVRTLNRHVPLETEEH